MDLGCHGGRQVFLLRLQLQGIRAGHRTVDKAVVHPPAHKVPAALQVLCVACVARSLALHQLVVMVWVYQVPALTAGLGSKRQMARAASSPKAIMSLLAQERLVRQTPSGTQRQQTGLFAQRSLGQWLQDVNQGLWRTCRRRGCR